MGLTLTFGVDWEEKHSSQREHQGNNRVDDSFWLWLGEKGREVWPSQVSLLGGLLKGR